MTIFMDHGAAHYIHTKAAMSAIHDLEDYLHNRDASLVTKALTTLRNALSGKQDQATVNVANERLKSAMDLADVLDKIVEENPVPVKEMENLLGLQFMILDAHRRVKKGGGE